MPAIDRAPVATRTNRGALLLLGLLLLAAGVLGLLVGLGGFGALRRAKPVLDPSTTSFADGHWWFWLAVAAAAVLTALLSLWWLRAQVATDRVRTIDLEPDRSRGATSLEVSALERACVQELESKRGIGGAGALTLGSGHEQQLVLRISLDGREPLRAVDAEVESDVLPKIRQVVGNPELSVRIEYRLTTAPYRH